MGHQVTFLILPTDLSMIEAAIRRTGDICLLDERSATLKPTEIATLTFRPGEMGRRPLGAYIARRGEVNDVKTRFIATKGYWVIDSLSSPVVEFSRCFFDGNVLRGGRAYFATDLEFGSERSGEDFVKWGDRVLAQIRRSLLRAPTISAIAYVSANARLWIEEHNAVGDNLLAFRSTKAAGDGTGT